MIRRRATQIGPMGGTKTVEVLEGTDVGCWQQNVSNREVQEYEKRGVSVTHKLYFTSDPGVTERHIIAVTERNGNAVSSPIVLEVRSKPLPDATVGSGTAYKVMVERRLDLRLQSIDVATVSADLLLLADGTLNSPSLTFTNDTNVGAYRPGDDMLAFVAGNVEFMRLVEAAQNELVVNEEGADVDFRVESDVDTHALFVQGSDGLVGIGESAPTGANLYITNDNVKTGFLQSRIIFKDENGSQAQIAAGTYGAAGNSKITFYTQESSGTLTNRVIINDEGNVGINQSNPDAARLELVVSDTDNVIGLQVTQNDTTSNPVASQIINAGTASGLVITQNGLLAGTDDNALRIYSNAAQVGGPLLKVVQDNASSTANVVNSVNDGTGTAIRAAQNGVLASGKYGIEAYSNAAQTVSDAFVRFELDNALSTIPCLKVRQDGAESVMVLDHGNTVAGSSFIDFQGTAAANATNPVSTLTTSGAVQGHIQVEINGVKRWIAFLADPS